MTSESIPAPFVLHKGKRVYGNGYGEPLYCYGYCVNAGETGHNIMIVDEDRCPHTVASCTSIEAAIAAGRLLSGAAQRGLPGVDEVLQIDRLVRLEEGLGAIVPGGAQGGFVIKNKRRISPPTPPKEGDLVEVSHMGRWEVAVITKVTADSVQGEVTEARIPTGFSYLIDSYRENWRYR